MIKSELYFEIETPLGVIIRITKKYWDYIIRIKHKIMAGKEEIVKTTLAKPDEVRRSKMDKNVFLYYKGEDDKLYCAVARHEGQGGFLITAYITDKVKEGEIVWTK